MTFANYDRPFGPGRTPYGHKVATQMIKFTTDFRFVEAWVLPKFILDKFEDMSNSGGSWGPDGFLYLTGHDPAEVYKMRLPSAGSVLELVEVIPANIRGQGIAWDRSERGVLYGITVDGSKGPAYRMKTGGVVIARECGKPIVLVRTWYRRCLRLPTWDRMAIPLPFNVIHYYAQGPYEVPPNATAEDELERFTAFLERELIALAARSYDDAGQARPANLVAPVGPDVKPA